MARTTSHVPENSPGGDPNRWLALLAALAAPALALLTPFAERAALMVIAAIEFVALVDWIREHPFFSACAAIVAMLILAITSSRSR